MSPERRGLRSENGFVTLAVAGLALVLIAVSAVVATLGAVAVARHRAAASADLAALAGAGHAVEGGDSACAAAADVARAQGARLTGCRLEGLDVVVEVTVTPPGRLGLLGRARAISRAGPAR